MKFYTLRLFQRAPAAPARGQWSPALNLQFCPHCQTLNDKNGATCTRCNQPLVAFAPGPVSLSTAIVGLPHRNRPADVDDVLAQTVLHQDAVSTGPEVLRRQLFSGKLAMIMSAVALGVALFSIFGTGRFQGIADKPAEHAASVRLPAMQAGVPIPGKGADPAGGTPAAAPLAPTVSGGAAGTHGTDAGSVAVDAPTLGPPALPVPADTVRGHGSDNEPRLLVPDPEDAAPRGAIALAPDPVPPEPTPLRATSQSGRVPGPAGAAAPAAAAGTQGAAPATAPHPDDATPLAAPQPMAGCTEAVKILGLCATPKNENGSVP